MAKRLMLIALLLPVPDDWALQRASRTSSAGDQEVERSSGILTDRLTPRQLRAWRAIESIIFARDASGQLTHPELQSLWERADKSGHLIYVEMVCPNILWDTKAGRFRIEKLDPDGRKHIAVIELCLPTIREALVRKRVQKGHGFIQFEGLSKNERYAEVLAHELGHAVWFLSDNNRAQMLDSMDRETEMYSRRRRIRHGNTWDEEMQRHLEKSESWQRTTETPARSAEAEVWRELLASHGRKARVAFRPPE